MRARVALMALIALLACQAEAPPIAPTRPSPPTLEAVSRKILYSLPPSPTDGLTHDIALEDASGHALDRLGDALLRSLRHEGVARLAFYGGSHTASDLYTAELRTRLQRRFGNAGHGFVLAAMPITDYWQSGAQVEDGEGWDTMIPDFKNYDVGAYGLAGAAFDAHVPAWAAAHTDRSSATHLEVLYLQQPGGGTFDVTIDGLPIETVDTASDAIGAGLHTYAVHDGPHRIELETTGDPSVRVFGFVFERETNHGVVVDQLGIAGSKARHQLFWDHDLWRTFLGTRHPDLISVAYGNNEGDDAHLTTLEHIGHFRHVLQRIREDFPRASCLVIGPSDRQLPSVEGGFATPPLILALRDAQREIAAEEGCAFFDTIAWQGGVGAVDRWLVSDPVLEREDRIHFTELGYRRLGISLLRAIGENLRHGAPLP